MKEENGENRRDQFTEPFFEPHLAELEDQVKVLIQEILSLCQMLKTNKDLSLGHELSSLCHELRVTKDLIVQAMEAMNFNANSLEGQRLNNPEEELKLKHAAEIGWAEVARLNQIIEEADAILTMADETMHELEKTPDQEWLFQHNRESIEDIELKDIFNDIDTFKDIPLKNHDLTKNYDLGEQEFSFVQNLKPPLLGDISSSGFENTLGKISKLSPISMRTQPDLFKDNLYKNDLYSAPMKLGDGPFAHVARSATKWSGNDDPIITQAGFNGGYISSRASENRPFFNLTPSRTDDDTKS